MRSVPSVEHTRRLLTSNAVRRQILVFSISMASSRCFGGTRTRAGEQRGNRASLIIAATDAVGIYEKLRVALLNAEPSARSGLSVRRIRVVSGRFS